MTGAMGSAPALRKEIRALAPAWIAAIAAVAVGSRGDVPALQRFGLLAYLTGAATLGALSIGHEYMHATLSSLLVQPRSRRVVLRSKLAALVPMVILFALASVALFGREPGSGSEDRTLFAVVRVVVLAVPVILAVGVAPWFTMICRSTIAGAVFTLAVPGVWWIAGVIVEDVFDLDPQRLVALGITVVGTIVTSVTVAVFGWRAFMRLEAIEAAPNDLSLPAWRTRAAATGDRAPGSTARRPFWRLAKKELRLQQLPIAVAGLYVAGWTAATLFDHRPGELSKIFYALSFLYIGLNALLIGSLASAEERQLGTAEWQALVPVSTAMQWTIKVGVVLALTLALTVALPGFLAGVSPAARVLVAPDLAVATVQDVVMLAVIGLYVSSFCRSGLWAMLMGLPVALAAPLAAALFSWSSTFRSAPAAFVVELRLWQACWRWIAPRGLAPAGTHALTLVGLGLPVLCVWGLAFIALRLGLDNHRSAERGAGRVWRQGVAIAAFVVLTGSVEAAVFEGSHWTPRFADWTRQHAAWQSAFDRLTLGFDGRVGVCAVSTLQATCERPTERFPMQSVWKLPLAVAVFIEVDRGALTLDDPVVVMASDLSVAVQPMAALVGPGGFKTTIGDLVRRAIVDSDNAAADVLAARLGGPAAIDAILQHTFFGRSRIDRDEKQLQTEVNGLVWRDDYLNPGAFDRAVAAVPEAGRDAAFQKYLNDPRDTTTPLDMATALDAIARGAVLSAVSRQHLFEDLVETTTFPDRLKAGVPPGWFVGHKTGTSGTWRGVTAATNDVAILRAPDGGYVSVAVFIAGSRASAAERAALMADIARAVTAGY